MTLQVQIRQRNGSDVSLDDCAHFNEPMSEALEASNILAESYILEISSPGIGESLHTDRDFETFRGFPIQISFRSENGSEILKDGLLQARSDNHVLLNTKGRITRILRKDVVYVRLTSPTG